MTIREILFENENENKKTSGVIFLNDRTAIVGITHGQKLELSPDTANKVKAIAAEYGAWYEGNGMDTPYTKGIIDEYRGSWEDDLLNKSIKGYPYEFLFVLFANIKENDTIRGKIGFDPSVTIFDRILKTQRSINYFVDRTFTANTLTQFLEAVSDEKHDFIEMSKKPATEKNVTEFFELGSALSWPSNWDQYPYNAGKVAERANLVRDEFLASRKSGVYVTGGGHLIAISKLSKKQPVDEGKPTGGLTKWFREKWVNIAKKEGGKHPACGTSGETRGYAKCVPAKKAASMSAKEKKSAVNRKRAAQRKAGRPGRASGGTGKAPVRVQTDK